MDHWEHCLLRYGLSISRTRKHHHWAQLPPFGVQVLVVTCEYLNELPDVHPSSLPLCHSTGHPSIYLASVAGSGGRWASLCTGNHFNVAVVCSSSLCLSVQMQLSVWSGIPSDRTWREAAHLHLSADNGQCQGKVLSSVAIRKASLATHC